jgi:hypothetical protein
MRPISSITSRVALNTADVICGGQLRNIGNPKIAAEVASRVSALVNVGGARVLSDMTANVRCHYC